jgi:glycosyltransferase involved in cell wall biosynthesis
VSEVWFWQLIVSPHMADLAVQLAQRGYKVVYVAQQIMSEDRIKLGWTAPSLTGVSLKRIENDAAVQKLILLADVNSIHICQGVRANGRIGLAQQLLTLQKLQQWVVMETVDDSGCKGILKRFVYSYFFKRRQHEISGVLATGYETRDWIVARKMPKEKIFPFAYFLPQPKQIKYQKRQDEKFRFIFVGQLISRKRVDYLIKSLATLNSPSFELYVIGDGPEKFALHELAKNTLTNKVIWFGKVPLTEVPNIIANSDCLVLPSTHDGWGAVASESLIVGTPVICSDACGVADVVRASGAGGVFSNKNTETLALELRKQLAQGPFSQKARLDLTQWANCLTAEAGANYLHEIFQCKISNERPIPPWLAT